MIKLVELKNDEVKIKEYNDLCEELKAVEPSIDWDKVKIKSINDEFYPYDLWLKELESKENIKLIQDTTENIKNIYVSQLNWDKQLERLTNYKFVKKYNEFNYGVCDNVSQILDYCDEKVLDGKMSEEKEYIIVLTPILKRNQGDMGWRWHKWGRYIGIQEPKCEYIADEENIDMVYVFHVKEVVEM